MHLIALVEKAGHVCCRYRVAAFRPFLERAGHTVEVCPLPRDWWSRFRLLHRFQGADVILQRRLLPAWQLALLRRRARWLAFDFDDAVFLRDSFSPRGLHHAGRLRRFAHTVRACDAVCAGNAFLFDHAARWAGPHKVHLVPTCVDPARYPLARHTRDGTDGRVRLVWLGSASTLQGLARVRPLLEELGRRVPGIELQLICDDFFDLEALPVCKCSWAEETEAEELAGADVGIAWVPDDLWSRGKCGLKVLQYLAAGLPVVANPVGVHPEMVRHGETGLLARTADEWVTAVARLALDPALRRRMGEAGRRLVEEQYSVAEGAGRWLRLLGDAPARRCA
jgi:glycosyltransferase involved in cell wall biosynthesis